MNPTRLILETFIQTIFKFSFLKIDNYECPHILNIIFDGLKAVWILYTFTNCLLWINLINTLLHKDSWV